MARIEIIAEIANAHQGDPGQAARLAEVGFDGGADAVKFQIYFAEEFLVRAHPRFNHFRKQAFSEPVWQRLIAAAARRGPVYCDVFGPQALRVAAENGAAGFKIHSSDTGNIPLLDELAHAGRRVFLSAGGTSARELVRAIGILGAAGIRPVLLHGFQSYPTTVEDSALDRLDWLRETFGARCDVGYMDHVAGDDEFAYVLPVAAIGRGATVIEKHITLERAAKGVDYYSSLEPAEFRRFVAIVRRTETAFGQNPQAFAPAERSYRDTVKKHWVTTHALPAGHLLTANDLVMKRVPDAKAGAVEMDKLIGRTLVRDVVEEHPLTRADVRQIVWALPVARSASSRLPGKAMLDVAGLPALGHLFERLKRIPRIDNIVFCTTTEPDDDTLADLAAQFCIDCHRGPVLDVLARMLGAIKGKAVDVVLRVTGDDILIDRTYVERAVAHHLASNAEYTDLKALPSGTEVEVFDAELLRTLAAVSADSTGTEYLTFYVTRNADQFRITSAPVDERHAHSWRLTLDTPEDYAVIGKLLDAMRKRGKALDYALDDIVEFFTANPDILALNAQVRQRSQPPQVDTSLDWRRIV